MVWCFQAIIVGPLGRKACCGLLAGGVQLPTRRKESSMGRGCDLPGPAPLTLSPSSAPVTRLPQAPPPWRSAGQALPRNSKCHRSLLWPCCPSHSDVTLRIALGPFYQGLKGHMSQAFFLLGLRMGLLVSGGSSLHPQAVSPCVFVHMSREELEV